MAKILSKHVKNKTIRPIKKATHQTNLHGFYVKGYKPNPTYKVRQMDGTMGFDLSWDSIKAEAEKLVPQAQTLIESYGAKIIKDQISPVQNTIKQLPLQTSPTTSQPLYTSQSNNTQKIILYGVGAVAGVLGIFALIKAIKK